MAASYSASPMVKPAGVVLPPASQIRPKTVTMASQIRAKTLTMGSQIIIRGGRAGKHNQLSMKSHTQMIPLAISSSSTSSSSSSFSFNNVRSHANDYRRAKPPSQRPLHTWLVYIGVAVWTSVVTLFNLLFGVKTKFLVLSVVLHDEDGHLIRDVFEYICQGLGNDKHALDESVKCLLKNADSCLFSSSMVCSNYLQVLDNMYKLYHDDFTLEAFAEDDINCTQVQIFLSTSDEISDENIHTIQDFKAFLRRLGSIKGERIGSCQPFNYYQRKGPIQRHKASNRYSHLRIPI